MLNISVFILTWSLATSPADPSPEEEVILDRIVYIYELKQVINNDVWKGFAERKFDLPLIYYTDSTCYVANPTAEFVSAHNTELVFEAPELKIYRTALVDSIPFHMETSITLGGASAAYNYKSPFMNCSSLEITRRSVPDVNSTEEWTTMIIHEYFHGFQFKHPAFLDHFETDAGTISGDSLKRIYKSHPWFKEGVDHENKMLLTALNATDDKQRRNSVRSFLMLREERRDETRRRLGVDISSTEGIYETMDGTARYVEYSLYGKFAKKRPDKRLIESDSSYHSYKHFLDYRMDNDEWLYLTDKTTYFYATGFNIVRLLDQVGIPYKAELFNDGDLTLEELLKRYISPSKR